MVFLLSEYHAKKIGRVQKARELRRMIHPLNAVSNTHYLLSVSKVGKETLRVTAH
jgi:hypothetical protein